MDPIDQVIRDILGSELYDTQSLATALDVSQSTVTRWLSGSAKPRPILEGRLRDLVGQVRQTRLGIAEPSSSYSLMPPQQYAGQVVDNVFRELREALHRRGRLSSRNEALDELSKLIFAHVMSLAFDGPGITTEAVLSGADQPDRLASSLRTFVRSAFEKHLPSSLAHEIGMDDFLLRIKPQEDALAREIIECFERLGPKNGLHAASGITKIDLLNDAFGKFLADSFLDERQLGQYLTPTEVVQFMVDLAINSMSSDEFALLTDPSRCSEFGLVLDPSCGTGSFLSEFLRVLKGRVSDIHGEDSTPPWLDAMVTQVMVGVDKSERMIRLALCSMALFGIPAARLHLANSLVRHGIDSDLTRSLEGKVAVIMTNPPFGAEFKGKDLTHYKIASTWGDRRSASVVSELLFMERYVDWLMPGGQCLAVVPDSILTNKGLYSDLRSNLAHRIEIQNVVSLPPVTFGAAGTSTKTSVLHFRKRREGAPAQTRTYFSVCQDIGYSVTTRESLRTKIANGGGDLPLILKEALFPDDEAALGRWVRSAEVGDRWDANYHATLPSDIESRLRNPLPTDVLVSYVAELSGERTDPRRWGSEDFQYIEISDVDPVSYSAEAATVPCSDAPSRARKLVRAGDVLFSTVRPERRAVAVIRDDQDGAVCTTGFAVLRPRGIDPFILAALLRSDYVIAQVMRNNIGIAYPAIEESCLAGVLLPINREDLDELEPSTVEIARLEKDLRRVRVDFADRLATAMENWKRRSASPTATPHRLTRTMSRPQSHKPDSDARVQGTLPF